ncbi:MAG: hypothetical protein ACM33B_05020 [Pseudomonadota bacterium]
MQRTLAVWLVALPAAAGGVLAAHAAAYAVAGGGASASHAYLPVVQALVCALLALGLGAATASARTGALGRPRAAVFAIAPPLAFLLQETAERGFALPLERVVLLGLLLQLPFALLAWAAARLLLRAAEALAPARPPVHVATPAARTPPLAIPRSLPVPGRRGRAPPLAAAS